MMDNALKNRYPFRLGTTSFIFPADYAANVRRLGPFVDEIELLLFESTPLPSPSDIDELKALAQTNNITYNVHLPIDIDLTADLPALRQQSIRSIVKAMDRVAPLHPTTHTLHLPFKTEEDGMGRVDDWQSRATDSLTRVLDETGIAPNNISVETIDFSPDWMIPIVEMLDLSVCVDVGHMILHGFDLVKVFGLFEGRITMLHIHGVAGNKDHLAVSHIEPHDRKTVSRFLNRYKESVSIEVFSLAQFEASMVCFPELMALGHFEIGS